MALLNAPNYLAFPFRIEGGAPAVSGREAHIQGQIEQVLFTNPGERVFRPEFGAGVRALVFEPNATALWEVTRRRMISSLAEALRGEVDPKTLQVEVSGGEDGSELIIRVQYQLTTIGYTESHEISLEG